MTTPSTGLARTARATRSDVSSLVTVVVEAVATELPDLAADPRISGLLHETVVENVEGALDVLAGTSTLDAVHAPNRRWPWRAGSPSRTCRSR